MAKKKAAKKRASGAAGMKSVEGNESEASAETAFGGKSAAIRAYLTSHPTAKGKEIVEALANKGIVVTPNYVSMTKHGMKKDGAIAGTNKGTGKGKNTKATGDHDALISAFDLLKSAGSIKQAKQLLDTAEKIKQHV